jgi:hypothetical protein
VQSEKPVLIHKSKAPLSELRHSTLREMEHSEPMRLEHQNRLKEAFGMQLEDKNDPSKD